MACTDIPGDSDAASLQATLRNVGTSPQVKHILRVSFSLGLWAQVL